MTLQPVTQNSFLENGEIKHFGDLSCIGLIPIPVQKHKPMQCTQSMKKEAIKKILRATSIAISKLEEQ